MVVVGEGSLSFTYPDLKSSVVYRGWDSDTGQRHCALCMVMRDHKNVFLIWGSLGNPVIWSSCSSESTSIAVGIEYILRTLGNDFRKKMFHFSDNKINLWHSPKTCSFCVYVFQGLKTQRLTSGKMVKLARIFCISGCYLPHIFRGLEKLSKKNKLYLFTHWFKKMHWGSILCLAWY